MNAGFELSDDGVNAATPTFRYIENTLLGGDLVSDFGEISYPLSTVKYEYTSCVLESSTDDLVFISQVHQLMG
jgi:hypothetical protein